MSWNNGPLARYIKLRVAHAPGIPETFSPPWVSDPDMHHGACVTHVLWCMPESLTSGFLWSRWWGKRSRHSRRMCNPPFYVSGNKPMACAVCLAMFLCSFEWINTNPNYDMKYTFDIVQNRLIKLYYLCLSPKRKQINTSHKKLRHLVNNKGCLPQQWMIHLLAKSCWNIEMHLNYDYRGCS